MQNLLLVPFSEIQRRANTFILGCFVLLPSFLLQAQPVPCGAQPDMTSYCQEACVICDIDGFTGINDDTEQGSAPPDFCTSTVHHAQWIAFIAGSTNLKITVTPSNCQTNFGLEVGIYYSEDCQNFTKVSNCDGDILPGETGVFVNTVPLVVGQYYYFVMDGNHSDICSYTIQVIEGSTKVPELPSTPAIDGPSSTCLNSTEVYTVPPITGANSYHWEVDGVPLAGTDPSQTITWTTPGYHQLCVYASNVCDTAASYCSTIRVHPPDFTPLTIGLCEGDCVQIADSNICQAGNYSFILQNQFGCDSTVQASVEILPQVSRNLALDICSTDSLLVGQHWYHPPGSYLEQLTSYNGCDSLIYLDLNAIICEIKGNTLPTPVRCKGESNGQLSFWIQDGTAPYQYSWKRINGSPSGMGTLSSNQTPVQLPNLPAGSYTITVNDNYGNDVVLTAVVTEPPTLTTSWQTSDYHGYAVACHQGSNGSLTMVTDGGSAPYSYQWSNGAQVATLQDLEAGFYSVTITDRNGCSLSASPYLSQPPALAFFIQKYHPDCTGPYSGQLAIQQSSGGVAPYEFGLNQHFSNLSSFENLYQGPYSLSLKDANGCTLSKQDTLIAALIPELELGDDLEWILGCTQRLQPALVNPVKSVMWWPSESLSCTDCLEPDARPFQNTEYFLQVVSKDGCQALDSVQVRLIPQRDCYVPNIFSPDKDGENDFLTVYAGKSVRQVRLFQVYSRWGELVFEQKQFPADQPTLGWNGTHRGQPSQAGVYGWIAEVEFLDNSSLRLEGNVTLVR
ncbi:MAG: gliding motility-associated C-terminal domain-containing protein [Chitinophagales bacterium]